MTSKSNAFHQSRAFYSQQDRRTQQISDALRQKRKDTALTYLRARKQLEEVLKKRLGSLELLQSTLLRVVTSAGDIEVLFHSLMACPESERLTRYMQIMKSYESSTATLREILAHPLLQRGKIDETMDAMAAANADAREVDDAIQMGAEMAQAETAMDDSELEAELQALVKEVELERTQAQRDRLGAEDLRTPMDTPSPAEASASLDKQKVPVAL